MTDSRQSDSPVITELALTCLACPTQWEGRCEDGLYIYIRWRSYRLGYGVGLTPELAVRQEIRDFRETRLNTRQDEGTLEEACELLGIELAPGLEVVERWDPYKTGL